MPNDIERNKDVVRRYLQAVIDGDFPTIDSLHHPKATYWVLGQGDMDRATYIGLVKQLASASKRNLVISSITAEDDRVSVECKGEMVFGDTVYRNTYNNMFVVRDGLIVAAREYMDPRASGEAFS
jgi:uncharacterized protein